MITDNDYMRLKNERDQKNKRRPRYLPNRNGKFMCGDACPQCGSTYGEHQDHSGLEGGVYYWFIICQNCGTEFKQLHRLTYKGSYITKRSFNHIKE